MDFLKRLITPARWKTLCLILLVVGLLCCLTSSVMDDQTYEMIAAVCLALAVGGTLFFWRCPRCQKRLPMQNMGNLDRCPHCRIDLRNYKY